MKKFSWICAPKLGLDSARTSPRFGTKI